MDGVSKWRTQGRLDALAANEEKKKEEGRRLKKSLEDDCCILPESISISFDQVLEANSHVRNLEYSHLRRSYLDMAEISDPPHGCTKRIQNRSARRSVGFLLRARAREHASDVADMLRRLNNSFQSRKPS